ncbi:uncharacterized protein BX663DRAFT_444998, partial [Cokeromyces recurvatus]|uniref:uncharacterized protein n=1 Tax=Cokeromyces recurvatus TaxID=90255 RepID=UPI00221E6019
SKIAAYECAKIDTTYKNGTMLQFGNKLRTFVNLLTQQKVAEKEIKKKSLKTR